MENTGSEFKSNVVVAKRRVSITTDQSDTIYFDFLEARDGRTFKSQYNMMIDQSEVTQPATVILLMAWLDFNDEFMKHPELTISDV